MPFSLAFAMAGMSLSRCLASFTHASAARTVGDFGVRFRLFGRTLTAAVPVAPGDAAAVGLFGLLIFRRSVFWVVDWLRGFGNRQNTQPCDRAGNDVMDFVLDNSRPHTLVGLGCPSFLNFDLNGAINLIGNGCPGPAAHSIFERPTYFCVFLHMFIFVAIRPRCASESLKILVVRRLD